MRGRPQGTSAPWPAGASGRRTQSRRWRACGRQSPSRRWPRQGPGGVGARGSGVQGRRRPPLMLLHARSTQLQHSPARGNSTHASATACSLLSRRTHLSRPVLTGRAPLPHPVPTGRASLSPGGRSMQHAACVGAPRGGRGSLALVKRSSMKATAFHRKVRAVDSWNASTCSARASAPAPGRGGAG